jgi:hypothetical protein
MVFSSIGDVGAPPFVAGRGLEGVLGFAAVADLDGEFGGLAAFVVDVHEQFGPARGIGAGGAQPDQQRGAEDLQHVHVAGVVGSGVVAAVEHPHDGVFDREVAVAHHCPSWTVSEPAAATSGHRSGDL